MKATTFYLKKDGHTYVSGYNADTKEVVWTPHARHARLYDFNEAGSVSTQLQHDLGISLTVVQAAPARKRNRFVATCSLCGKELTGHEGDHCMNCESSEESALQMEKELVAHLPPQSQLKQEIKAKQKTNTEKPPE